MSNSTGVFTPSMINFGAIALNKDKVQAVLDALPNADNTTDTFHGTGTGATQSIPGFLDQIDPLALNQLRQLLTDMKTSIVNV